MKTEALSDKAVLGEIGRRLKGYRLNLNLSQAEVARKAGVSRRAFQKLEGGRAGARNRHWIRRSDESPPDDGERQT